MDIPTQENQAGGGDIDVDSLMEGIDSSDGNDGILMTSDESAPEKAAAASAPQTASDLEFTWNGQSIKTPFADPRVKQWASQGYDYAQRIQAFNQERLTFENQRKEFGALETRYKEVDEYAKSNPDWWEKVEGAYLADKNKIDPNNPINPVLQKFEQKLNDQEKFINSIKEKEQQAFNSQEDAKLDSEIKSIQEKYPDISLSTVDETGRSLELRVLDHAAKNGIKSFQTAFRDLLHDDLIKRTEEKGKLSAQKEMQAKRKAGLLGSSPTPIKGVTESRNVKNKSYNDLLDEAMSEIQAG